MSRKERKALMRKYEPTRAERRLAAALMEETGEGLGEPIPHDVAFLVVDVPAELGGTEKVVWFASSPADAKAWDGPVSRLVLGVREAASSADVSPHRWMRNRILTTREPGELERAVVKVAASKVTRVVPEAAPAKPSPDSSAPKRRSTAADVRTDTRDHSDVDDDALARLPRLDAAGWAEFAARRGVRESRACLPAEIARVEREGTKQDDTRLFAWATAFAAAQRRDMDSARAPLATRDRAVVAMLISRDGALLDCAVNTNARNRALHAEANLLAPWLEGLATAREETSADAEEEASARDDETNPKISHHEACAKSGSAADDETDADSRRLVRPRGRLPPGARVLVTLQCCRMCAALICAVSDDARERYGIETLRDVVYAEKDRGKYSRDTALQRRGLEREWRSTRETEAGD